MKNAVLISRDIRPDKHFTGSALVISRHDYRSRRKTNMHFITQELAKRGKTRFFSFGFSFLSYLKDDPRLSLWKVSNKAATFEGVECYLWRTLLHPINLRRRSLRVIEAWFFKYYMLFSPKIFRQWIKDSNVILFESGFPVIFVRMCKRINPNASLLYIASDGLKTIDCADYIIKEFTEVAPLMDGIRLPSHKLSTEMPSGSKIYFVPHGLDKHIADHTGVSPYQSGIHAVSVGSMLFDAGFFTIAAQACPHITFHIIGGGAYAAGLSAPNIKLYGEMPFFETIPYIKHATFGIAPYNGRKVAPFLVDTSLKLAQYGFLGVPAVCPQIVVGRYKGRFGYQPDDRQSISEAIHAALAFGHFTGNAVLSWSDVTDRLLAPQLFDDTRVIESA